MNKSTIKNFIIIVVVVAVLLAAYILFIKPDGSNNSNATLTSSSTGQSPAQNRQQETATTVDGDSLLRILNSLEGLELNDSIFFNPAFGELRDIGIPLVKEGNPGRRNPFAPIGNDPVPVPVTNGTTGTAGGDTGTNGTGDDAANDNGSNDSSDQTSDNDGDTSNDSGGGFGIFGS